MRRRSAGQSMVEFALLSGVFFLLVMGIFDLGRAVAVYISIAEAAHEGARQLVLRSNAISTPPDTVIVNATLAKIGGGGLILIEDPCLPGCSTPAQASTNPPTNSGYIWITPNRIPGNHEVTVQITYAFSPMTAVISQLTGTTITMTASSSMRAEY
ncbi:MAG TPA: TadE/TadG family type IV pilus assembly protein [Candidatus Eisenbacteria bacterium]|jgi:Flp pilus assembly protein TadG|nr:TadE/TadG family type IV pilus assembly protein [Candidatus Eisenbacteria bacterium]